MMVVLPEPLGPRKPKTSPRAIWKLTLSTAVKEPNLMVSWLASITVLIRNAASLKVHGGGHAGFEDAAGVIDVDLDAEDEVFSIVGGLDVAGQKFTLGGDLLHRSGKGMGEAIDADVGVLSEADVGKAGFGDVDFDPQLRSFLHGDDDLAGRDEIAGADADDFNDGAGGGDEFRFTEAGVELGNVTLGLGEAATSGFDVFAAESFARKDGSGLGLAVAGFCDAKVFGAGSSLKQCETLACGFGALGSGIALVAGVVELLARDSVGGDELFHADEEGLRVDGLGLGGGVVRLSLLKLFGPRAVAGFFKGGGLGSCGGLGLFDLFGTIAAEHAIEVGLGLQDGCGGLCALSFQLIALEADEKGAGGDVLAFFDGDCEDTAADFGADLDLACFDGAGVGGGGSTLDEGDDDPDGKEQDGGRSGDEDLALLREGGHH